MCPGFGAVRHDAFHGEMARGDKGLAPEEDGGPSVLLATPHVPGGGLAGDTPAAASEVDYGRSLENKVTF